jgi:hypothetical protein
LIDGNLTGALDLTMILRRLAAMALMLAASVAAHGQDSDRWEVQTTEPVFKGTHANAPIPGWLHILNEGGSDGAGLCVIASNVIDGTYQEVPEFAGGKSSKIWTLAKSKPGGYYPAKLEKLFTDSGMVTKWFQAEGSAAQLLPVIEYYTRAGVPCGTTMSYGKEYGQSIHHMVSTIHLDSTLACIVDNNFPGKYFWMSRAEYARRLIDGPAGWVVVLLRAKEIATYAAFGAAVVVALAGLLFAFASVVVWMRGT